MPSLRPTHLRPIVMTPIAPFPSIVIAPPSRTAAVAVYRNCTAVHRASTNH